MNFSLEHSILDDDTRRERDDLRSVNRLISDQSKVIQEFTNQMADIRAEIDKETELLSNTLESINKRNKKFFDTWDAMMKKLTTKRKIPGGNRNRRSRTKTVNDQKETKFNLVMNFTLNLLEQVVNYCWTNILTLKPLDSC